MPYWLLFTQSDVWLPCYRHHQ